METEIKKKEQTMMCAENLKINEMRDKKINSQTTRETSGITLIALVVTIVVLLILAGITISLVFSENGIIAKAKEAAEKTNQAAINEQEQMNEVAGYLDNMLNEIGGNTPPEEPTLPSDGSYSEEKGVNTPNLGEGMTPIKWDETKKDWVETYGSDPEWYNYGETESTRKWANAKTSDGSMWVWIPRYAYSITSGYHKSGADINSTAPEEGAGTIEVEFMKGISSESSTGRINFQNVSGEGKWNIHPAFNYGQTVSGIWVAKFEASSKEGNSNSDSGDNVITKTLQVKPGVSSWRYITIGNMYTVCKNYNSTLNSHMMKNDEWGAVAYLSKSKYGKNGKVDINDNSSYYTGGGNGNAYVNNIKQSTTGTIYGVYDMSGGAGECVASYINNENSNLTDNGQSLVNGDKKTKNVYIMTGEDKDTNNYNANSSKYGDAVYETSSNGNSNNGSWYNNASYFIYTVWPFFDRGGYYKSNFKAGMFCFGGHWGTSVEYESFRPVLSVI
mgnify:CR=1 FL=1